MLALRTLIFFVGWFSLTLAMGIISIPTILSQRALWAAAHLWSRLSLGWLRISCGITSHVEGAEHLRGARIVASKHQSAWDTLILWSLLKNPVFVLKRELYWIPIFGWYLWRTGQIAIDRSKPQGAIELIAQRMKEYEGRTLIIFPEGTRVPPGTIKPFRHGIARISAALNQPVVPTALNAGLFWPKRPIWKRPGHATIRFLPPLSPPSDINSWMEQLQAQVLSETEKLMQR